MLKRLELSKSMLPIDASIGVAREFRGVWFLDLIERSSIIGYETSSNICNGTKDYCLDKKDAFVKENPGTLYRVIN